MNPTDFLDGLEVLKTSLARNKSARVVARKEKNHVRSLIEAWFRSFRPRFEVYVDDETALRQVDDSMQDLLKLSSKISERKAYLRIARRVERYFRDSLLVPLSRAYWSQAAAEANEGMEPEVARRLSALDPALRDSYEQAIEDMSNEGRKTYRGPANELREVLREVLHKLAPDKEVTRTDWWKARRASKKDSNPPTHAERTIYILRAHRAGSAAEEAAESFLNNVEERLGQVVRASYRRASASTHAGAERDEVLQQLRYINALLTELLPADVQRQGVH